MVNWRKFLHELGITDFVQTVCVEKTVSISSHFVLTNMIWEKEIIPSGATIIDWESRELVELLAKVSLSRDRGKCKYLLEVIDEMWDDYFSNKDLAYCNIDGESKPFKSAIVSALNDVKWVASSVDDGLYYPKDLFHSSVAVCSILGDNAPYAVPKIRSEKLVTSIGFKITVTLHEALSVLQIWKRSITSFRASISQMSRFYSFIWNEMACSDQKSMANLSSGEFIFIPFILASSSEVVSGALLSPQEVYWHDAMFHPECEVSKMLSNLYPSLHDFFVNECGVKEKPPLLDYLAFLRHLSTVDTPLKSAKKVFDVFVTWSDGIKSGLMGSEDIEMLKRNLQQKETKVIPTTQDKWVSLHSSFGLVYWCDDEKFADEFEELNIIDFFHLCEVSDEEKEMLQVKVSHLMKNLGIPALSEVVTREAIYYGPVDNSYETSLVSWVLPYAQRYISITYRERYLQLKLSGFEELNRLQIIVVEKLYYKNIIRCSKWASKKRHASLCLLQDETLYLTRASDSHSIFMELSRFLINGDPELHMVNFLHMITNMTESGSTEEQIEAFVLNSQKVPNFPDDEPLWSIQPLGPMSLNVGTPSATRIPKKPVKRRSSFQSNRNWPPASWQTAPKFISSCVNDTKMQDDVKQNDLNACSIDEHVISTDQVDNLKHSTSSNNEGHGGTNSDNPVNVKPGLVDQEGPLKFSQRDQLSHGMKNMQQAFLTGRQGEEVAFKYYSKKVGIKFVTWVNEAKETGLPYDIEVFDDENKKEYIEVKTTNSAKKDWFELSFREWQFAVEEGESFSIARVVLAGDKTARVTIFKNPARLCRLGHLKLAVLMSKQKDELVLC